MQAVILRLRKIVKLRDRSFMIMKESDILAQEKRDHNETKLHFANRENARDKELLAANERIKELEDANVEYHERTLENEAEILKFKTRNTALESAVKVARESIKDSWNKLECHIAGCVHKTRAVNSSGCSAHRGMMQALTKLDEALK